MACMADVRGLKMGVGGFAICHLTLSQSKNHPSLTLSPSLVQADPSSGQVKPDLTIAFWYKKIIHFNSTHLISPDESTCTLAGVRPSVPLSAALSYLGEENQYNIEY